MKSVVGAATLAVAMLAAASQASAAQSMSFSPAGPDGSLTGAFGDTAIGAGAFTDTFDFMMPTGMAGATIASNFTPGAKDNVNFTSVTFDGQALNIDDKGQVDLRSLTGLPVVGGAQTLVVKGSSGQNGSFSGTLSLAVAGAAAAAAPEPASWALMMLGFGGAGALIRARRRATAATAA
ncbi:FxDxF family PEP-CTERM protein [Phenylobacterium sp.]|jgi:hypothetical protein|uniref:FxDxF family PEP-CTERM protein n=1 Tax=Phenylobacterium sp. TaxID=1871053 RepID=UPI002E31ECAC|nr:FxDxF family PEP-CTERM protein [Phenylobacterium sp.]HEX3366690.1 FxDxF family PEP-CTERM protein [Phenylobacterium sp.]